VALLRGVAGGRCGVKASGGIRTLADVKTMLEAGANRIGASASVAIVREMGAE
jgi:deoxyribose-phosphate aldolase